MSEWFKLALPAASIGSTISAESEQLKPKSLQQESKNAAALRKTVTDFFIKINGLNGIVFMRLTGCMD
jgi:hypothetical protein